MLVNTEGTGFYRVRYAPDLLAALVTHAQSDLSPIERYGLIDDAWAAVLAGETGTVDFLEMLDAFADETDLTVWQRIVGCLHAIDRLIDAEQHPAFQRRVCALIGPASARLGPARLRRERPRPSPARCALRGARRARRRPRWPSPPARSSRPPASADPAMVAAAVDVVAATGDETEFEAFPDRFRDASTPQEELRYLSALADFDDPELMRRLLAMTIDGIRTQNAPLLLRRAITNRTQGARAWEFVAAQWDTINERFPSNSIARILEGVRSLSSPDVAPEVFVFFETHEVPQGDKILAQHLERLEVNVALRAREAEALNAALG